MWTGEFGVVFTFVPFDVQIPDNEIDKQLPEKLEQELPGILNYILKGCREWQQVGLIVPDRIKKENAVYREEMDPVGNFLESECVTDVG